MTDRQAEMLDPCLSGCLPYRTVHPSTLTLLYPVDSHGLGTDAEDQPTICPGCKREVDPDTCGCGDSKRFHSAMDPGHSFVPIGCVCFYDRSQS